MPRETDPPLVIDPNAVLPLAVPAKGFEAVARQEHQRFKRVSGVKDSEAFFRLSAEGLKHFDILAFIQPLGVLVLEALYHGFIVNVVRGTSRVFWI